MLYYPKVKPINQLYRYDKIQISIESIPSLHFKAAILQVSIPPSPSKLWLILGTLTRKDTTHENLFGN